MGGDGQEGLPDLAGPGLPNPAGSCQGLPPSIEFPCFLVSMFRVYDVYFGRNRGATRIAFRAAGVSKFYFGEFSRNPTITEIDFIIISHGGFRLNSEGSIAGLDNMIHDFDNILWGVRDMGASR